MEAIVRAVTAGRPRLDNLWPRATGRHPRIVSIGITEKRTEATGNGDRATWSAGRGNRSRLVPYFWLGIGKIRLAGEVVGGGPLVDRSRAGEGYR